MANNLTFENGSLSINNITEYPNSFKRQGAFPLERYSVFNTLEGLKDYVLNNPVAYVGQLLVLVKDDGTATTYVIQSDNSYEEVGKATYGDNKTIELNGETLSLKGFGDKYYPYNSEKKQYADTPIAWDNSVSIEMAISNGEIIWRQSNPTTVEGIQAQVTTNATNISSINKRIDSLGTVLNLKDTVDEDTFLGWSGDVTAANEALGITLAAGDVILVKFADVTGNDIHKEYVVTADSTFELLGDPSGVTALAGTVTELSGKVTTNADGIKANTEAIETLKTVDTTNLAAAKAYTDEQVAIIQAAADKNATDISDLTTIVNNNKTSTDNSIADLVSNVAGVKSTADAAKATADGNSSLIAGLQTTVDGHTTSISKNASDIAALQTTVGGNSGSITALQETLESKADVTTVSSLATRLGTAEGNITELTTLVNTKANAADVYEKTEVDTAIANATYDDSAIRALITANTNSINTLVGKDTTKSAREIAAEEVANIVAGAPEAYDTLAEIAAWINKHPESVAEINTRLEKLEQPATDSTLGIVKTLTDENGVMLNTNSQMEVHSLNVTKLTQSAGDTLVLNGGSANN